MTTFNIRCLTLTTLVISGAVSANGDIANLDEPTIQLSSNWTAASWEMVSGSNSNLTVSSSGLVELVDYTIEDTFSGTVRVTDIYGRTATFALSITMTDSTVDQLPPQNTVLPVVSGQTVPDNTLSVSTGTWANEPDSYSYQSYYTAPLVDDTSGDTIEDDNNDQVIDGVATNLETDNNYVITSGEIGSAIGWTVTATNEAGSASVDVLSNFITSPSYADAYVGSGFKNTAGSEHTWTNQSIGTANTSRVLLICLETQGGTAAQHAELTVKVGTTTRQARKIQQATTSASTLQMSVWIVIAPTGIVGDIYARYSSDAEIATSVARATIHVYAHARTATETSSSRSSSAGPYASALVIPTGGAGFLFSQSSSASAISCTWTNATENYDHNLGTGNMYSSGAIRGTAGSTTITSSWSGGTPQRFIYVAFGPAS